MSPTLLDVLRHMGVEAAYLEQESIVLEHAAFLSDERADRALTRSIEIIGEGAKKIPSDVRQRYPVIQWRLSAGMRDKLVHDYFDVDYDLTWDVAATKAPELRRQLEMTLSEIE